MSPLRALMRRSVSSLLRVACLLALLALGILCVSILVPRPLPVIFAMSAGHAVGGAAFALYLLAVILNSVLRLPAQGASSAKDASE